MGRHYKGTKRETRALDAFVKLMRASDTVHAASLGTLAGSGLTASQFAVLEALYHAGPMCLSDIGRRILKTSGNITMVVDNLEKRGLARRRQGKDDRRFISVHVTDKGARLMARIFPKHAAGIAKILGRLKPAEQESLARLCRKLGLGSAV